MPMKTLTIHIGGRRNVVPSNVILFEGDCNYSHVHFKNGDKITVATTLKSLEERFVPFNFYRSHKKYLVNIKEVASYKTFQVSLSNNKTVLVSRRKEEELLKRLEISNTQAK